MPNAAPPPGPGRRPFLAGLFGLALPLPVLARTPPRAAAPRVAATVATAAELKAAFDAIPDDGGDWTILLAEGAEIGARDERIPLAGRVFRGALADPNAGRPNAAHDETARAALRGGSVTIACARPLGARIRGRLQIAGSGPIGLAGIDFTNTAGETGYHYGTGAPNGDPRIRPNSTTRQLEIASNKVHSARSAVLVQDCRFGGAAQGEIPGRWPLALHAGLAGTLVVEDCLFDGIFVGVSGASIDRYVVRRNAFRRQLTDAIRAMGNRRGEMAAERVRFECVANTVTEPHADPDWSGAHADGIQIGTQADGVSYDLLVTRNYLGLGLPLVGQGGDWRAVQGIWMDDSPQGVFQDGEVSRNFIETNAINGIGTWRSRNLVVEFNTVIRASVFPAAPHAKVGPKIGVNGEGRVTVRDNIAGLVGRNRRSSAEVDLSGNAVADPRKPPGAPQSYEALFRGPFGRHPQLGAQYALDRTDARAFRADADRVFAARPGGPGAGRGHLG
jgi:hypothetical protein